MTVTEKSNDNFIVRDIIFGQVESKEYLYYSKEESVALFKEEFEEYYLQVAEADTFD